MIHVRTGSNALCHGSYRNVVLTNHQLIFERRIDDERMLVAINASDAPFTAHNGELGGTMTDLLTGNEIQMSGQLEIAVQCAVSEIISPDIFQSRPLWFAMRMIDIA